MVLLEKLQEEKPDMPKLVITSIKSSCGYNFYKRCTVIMMQRPTDHAMYKQQVGRSNRLDYQGEKEAILISEEVTSQKILEETMMIEFKKGKLFEQNWCEFKKPVWRGYKPLK